MHEMKVALAGVGGNC
uniref:Uncharacterized protein n=1 Tax=Arundo donax TaxID=35708 RepID=A0A0A9HQ45_ARUDO